jgi:predicted transcriptional regulator
MIRTVIRLDTEDKRWLEHKARDTKTPMTALIRQAIRRMRQEDEANSPSLDTLLDRTKGMWTKGDGLAYQQAVRSE